MKKVLYFVLFLIILYLTGCLNNKNLKNETDLSCEEISESKDVSTPLQLHFYDVVIVGDYQYQVYIYNINGNLIYTSNIYERYPSVFFINENTVCCMYDAGTLCTFYQYIDVINNKVSHSIQNVYAYQDELAVVYNSTDKTIEIINVYSQIIIDYISLNFAQIASPFENVEFNNNYLLITYYDENQNLVHYKYLINENCNNKLQ